MDFEKKYIILILFNYALIFATGYNNWITSISAFYWSFFWIGAILITLGTIVYLKTHDNAVITQFFYLMNALGFMLIWTCYQDYPLLKLGSLILLTLAPLLLFNFFCHFMNLTNVKLFYLIRKLLIFQFVITIVIYALGLFFHLLIQYEVYALAINFLSAIASCSFIYFAYKNKIRPFAKWQSKLLISAVFVALVPFTFIFIIPVGLFGYEYADGIYSAFLIILLPIAISYILIKKNVVSIQKILLLQLSVSAILAILFNMFLWLFVKPELTSFIFLNLFFVFSLMIYSRLSDYFTDKQIKISDNKHKYKKEKLELFTQAYYDNYLSGLVKLIKRQLKVNDVAMIWKEKSLSILSQDGIFENGITTSWMEQLPKHGGYVTYKDVECLSVPFRIVDDKTIYGWLVVEVENYSTDWIKDANELADFICETLHNSRVLFQAGEKAVPYVSYKRHINFKLFQAIENAQREMSKYLHDEILQNIYVLQVAVGELKVDTERKEWMSSLLNQLIVSARNKMFDVYPVSLSTFKICESLEMLLEKMEERLDKSRKIEFHLDCPESLNFAKELIFPVYKIIKELNQNAVKHSAATKIMTRLYIEDNILFININDNGSGLDIYSLEDNRGTGLLSVKHDVNMLHGKLKIESNNGTSIYITIPLLED